MLKCGDWPTGICSWSLNNDINLLNELRISTGIDCVHLALNPQIEQKRDRYLDLFIEAGWKFSATMAAFGHEDYSTLETIKNTGGIVPDKHWLENRLLVCKAIELTSQLKVKYLEFHFGFIDDGDVGSYKKLLVRTKELAEIARQNGVVLLMETGQETAHTLRHFLEALGHDSVAVNFDPANMILYGKGDPVAAAEELGQWIRHVHIKDAVGSKIPGQWGQEVPWGSGQVGAERFLQTLKNIAFAGTLSIEREAGASRSKDIEIAVTLLSNFGL